MLHGTPCRGTCYLYMCPASCVLHLVLCKGRSGNPARVHVDVDVLQELLRTASVLPTAGPKLVLFNALAHQASPQLVRELLSALGPQRAAADLAQALQNLPQAQQRQVLPLASLLQQVLGAQEQFEVCVTVSTGPASELQREGDIPSLLKKFGMYGVVLKSACLMAQSSMRVV